MDKFAMLQLKKKKAREEELRRLGMEEGDTHAPVKITEAEKDEINKTFGYPHEPTAVNCVSKYSPPDGRLVPASFAAAVWWHWEGHWMEPSALVAQEAAEIAREEAEKAAAKAAAELAMASTSDKKKARRGTSAALPPNEPPKAGMFGRSFSISGGGSMFGGPKGGGKPGGLSKSFSFSAAKVVGNDQGDDDEDEDDEDVDWSSLDLTSKKALKAKQANQSPKLSKKEKAALAAAEERIRAEAEKAAKEEEYEKEQKRAAARAKYLINWEVARYKREPPGLAGSGDPGGWKYKGSQILEPVYEGGRLKMQTMLYDLGENAEYR